MVGERANQAALKATVSDVDYGAQGVFLVDNIYFNVPFEQKAAAKAAGLRWDSAARKWYAASAEIASALHDRSQPALGHRNKLTATISKSHFFKRIARSQ